MTAFPVPATCVASQMLIVNASTMTPTPTALTVRRREAGVVPSVPPRQAGSSENRPFTTKPMNGSSGTSQMTCEADVEESMRGESRDDA